MTPRTSSTILVRSVSRRRLIATAGLSGAALAASALACSTAGRHLVSRGRGAPSQTAGQPKKGGTLNYAGGIGSFDLAGRTWDPQIQTQSGARSYRLFYDTLLVFDLVTYDVQPWLAQNGSSRLRRSTSSIWSRTSSGRTNRRSMVVL